MKPIVPTKKIRMPFPLSGLTSLCTLILWNLLFSVSPTSAQPSVDSCLVGRKIIAVHVQGNEKTRTAVILREMKQRPGDRLDLDRLEEDRKRIQNLNLFNRVIILAEPEGEGVRLRIIVTEQWYIFPYPILFINDRDWSKLSYGAGLTHVNFRGRAEILSFLFWLRYNPSVRLDYANPWLGGKRNLSTQVSFYYQKIRSKHFEEENVDENHLGVQWTVGKRFGYHTFVNLTLGYKEITLSPPVPGETLSPSGRDRLPLLGLFFCWDHRDLKAYPHSGWLVRLDAKKTGFPSLPADYLRYGFDIRKYFPLGPRWTLACRTATDLSAGTIPVYDRVFLGYGERIRGHFFEKFEGENRALASMALRFTVLPIRYFDLYDYPEVSDLKFGISFGLFADTGLTWFQEEKVKTSSLQSGYGFGLHLHLPYIDLLRLELAFDEEGQEQFIADLKVDI